MGEIADMMLEGFMDEETGEIIDGEAPGYPRRMSDNEPVISKSAKKRANKKARMRRLAGLENKA